MNVKFINPFLEATVTVMKTMAFIDPKPGKPYLKKEAAARGDVSAIIGLAGAAKGSLALSFSEKSILKIVSNMLGEEFSGVNNEVRDAVGEITNMVSGVARKSLEAQGLSVVAAIPTVVSGKGHTITHVLGGASIIIPFDIPEGQFFVDVCIDEA